MDLSADTFFRLSAVVDWVQRDRADVQRRSNEIDDALRLRIARDRAAYEADSASLDTVLPPIPFERRRPATFALIHLLRILAREARAFQFAPHDGLDLCHAVLGAGHAHLATLDRQWKRRVEQIPQPHELAQIYFRPQVGDLVQRFEALVADR